MKNEISSYWKLKLRYGCAGQPFPAPGETVGDANFKQYLGGKGATKL